MPAGIVHNYYHKLWRFPVFAVSTVILGLFAIYLVFHNPSLSSYVLEFWFWTNVWYVSGSIISPDLDLLGVNVSEGAALRKYGLLGVFFFGYSSFYAALMQYIARKFKIKGLFGSHRSWLTHSPIGTLIRIFFINAPLAYLYQMVGMALSYGLNINLRFADSDLIVFFAAQILGLGIADGIHVWLDLHYSESVKDIGK